MKRLIAIGIILVVSTACSRDENNEAAPPSGEPAAQGEAEQTGAPAKDAPPTGRTPIQKVVVQKATTLVISTAERPHAE